MKSATLLVALLFAGTALVAVAPAAEAANVCTNLKDAGCPALVCHGYDYKRGEWKTCVLPTIVCVREPCPPYGIPYPPVLP